ncbi:MAG: polyribonucleotide nucleotidyltransferase [bacterium]|nr:polyribonucleotide nucleotidyltransferase [bacterium]
MEKKEFTTVIGGKTLTATFSNLAERAHGSVMIKYGNSIILATAVMSSRVKEGTDFLPLTVEYEEKFYASGQILGSKFVRREGRPSDEAVLSGRIIDRTIRPLFDQWIRNDIQIIITVLSIDQDDPDILGVLGASLAISTSHIPWNGPVSAVRIAKIKGHDDLIINPNYGVRDNPELEFELVACGKDGKINMIELGGNEVQEETVVSALEFSAKEIEQIQEFQKKIIAEIGKPKKIIAKPIIKNELKNIFKEKVLPLMSEYIMSGIPGGDKIEELRDIWMKEITSAFHEDETTEILANDLFEEEVNEYIHNEAIVNNRRADGRGIDEIRPLYAEAGGISPVLHGSGIFYRGQTHVLSALTLGAPGDAQTMDGIEVKGDKRYIHHYNFPPFSTGETGRSGGMNRRAIGHGALAEKALTPMIPAKEVFPYTIRIVSEALSSNGSTSMASVCGSTIALMDAGVPIKNPVAGISSGVMIKDEKNFKVLTDIQGPEDHYGDMDFKVAGTKDGVTAIQMDVKVDGIPINILSEAFKKAKTARMTILDVILKAIPAPRKDISPNAPKILTLKVKVDQIGLVIGPGGKNINGIKDETGVDAIDIDDDGTVFITGKNGSAEKAYAAIEGMTKEWKIGDRVNDAVVTRLMDFGAFVKIGPNAEGLVHVSEMAPFRIDVVSKYIKIGQIVPVVVKEIDEKGRLNLSIKQADKDFIKQIKF